MLGATFKPNTDDVRDLPRARRGPHAAPRRRRGRVYDPQGMDNARNEFGDVTYADDRHDAVTGADLVCVLTEWEEFRNADPTRSASSSAGKRVIDGLNEKLCRSFRGR